MGGPGWWTVSLVAVVAVASVGCLGHLLLARRHRRRALDVVDLGMGVTMLVMLAGIPLGRPVAWAALAVFAGLAVASVAGPAVAAVRGGVLTAGGRPAVTYGAMAVMLVPLAAGQHHAMGGGPVLIVAAALTTAAVLAVGAADAVDLRSAPGDRLTTACRLAMGVAAAVMLVGMIH